MNALVAIHDVDCVTESTRDVIIMYASEIATLPNNDVLLCTLNAYSYLIRVTKSRMKSTFIYSSKQELEQRNDLNCKMQQLETKFHNVGRQICHAVINDYLSLYTLLYILRTSVDRYKQHVKAWGMSVECDQSGLVVNVTNDGTTQTSTVDATSVFVKATFNRRINVIHELDQLLVRSC